MIEGLTSFTAMFSGQGGGPSCGMVRWYLSKFNWLHLSFNIFPLNSSWLISVEFNLDFFFFCLIMMVCPSISKKGIDSHVQAWDTFAPSNSPLVSWRPGTCAAFLKWIDISETIQIYEGHSFRSFTENIQEQHIATLLRWYAPWFSHPSGFRLSLKSGWFWWCAMPLFLGLCL